MKASKPKIMIHGFYGAGNSGDEAMLKNFYYHIKRRLPEAVILVATEQGRGSWLPGDLHYINAMDRVQVQESDLLVIGGGGLGAGFGWNLLPIAKLADPNGQTTKAVSLGMSYGDEWFKPSICEASKEMLKLYDLIMVRDKKSYEQLIGLGLDAICGTDIAIDLPEAAITFNKPENCVVVVIRETPKRLELKALVTANYALEYLNIKGYNIILLPFCKEDYVLATRIQQSVPFDMQIINTGDPQQHKFIINRADFLVTLGRYHPIVYATEQGIPTIACSWPCGRPKIDNFMEYLGNSDYLFHKFDDINSVADFKKKFELLANNAKPYKEKMLLVHQEHAKINNEQFDKIVALIS